MREPIPVRIIKPIYHNVVGEAMPEIRKKAYICAIGNWADDRETVASRHKAVLTSVLLTGDHRMDERHVDKKGRKTHLRIEIPSQRNSSTDNTTQIKDGPEDANRFSLLILGGICKHERSLRGPKQTSTCTKDSAGSNDETSGILMDVHDAGHGYEYA